MKVIFLDVDGVLNSEKFAVFVATNELGQDFLKEGGSNFVDPYATYLIADLCEAHDLKIVISSSWRMYDLPTTVQTFERYRDLKPLIPYMVGVTPRNSDDRIWEDRGEEIQHYLDEHPDIENYCIIDDDNDMLESQLDHFVRVDSEFGLEEVHIEKVKTILNLK